MLEVFEIGEESFRLLDGSGRDVGWIRGSAIGFGGLRTEDEAMRAAAAGHAALAAYVQRSFGGATPTADPAAPLRIVHDGAYEWVSRGAMPLARIVRPGAARRGARDGSYGIELVVPSYVRAGATIAVAQQAYRAIHALAPAAVAAPAARSAAGESTLDAR